MNYDINHTGKLTLRCRRGFSLQLKVKGQARTGASYLFRAYNDNDSIAYTGTVTASNADVVVTELAITTPTGVYRYELSRTAPSGAVEKILEGNLIITP